jgi:hypothetical protein
MVFHANSRHDTVDANDTVHTGNTFHHVDGVFQLTGPKFHVYADEIILQAGGSQVLIRPGGISITSSGPVEIIGAPIKLNC